jgi:hypothetical protein
MDRETFEEIVWIGCGIEVTRLMWINQPFKEYLMSLGTQFNLKGSTYTLILNLSDCSVTLEETLQMLANKLYYLSKALRDEEDDF